MISKFLRSLGANQLRAKKPYNRIALHLAQLEERCVPATIQMYPGGDLQTILPYQYKPFAVIDSTNRAIVADANNQPFDFNKDGIPDALNLGSTHIYGNSLPSTNDEIVVSGRFVSPLLANSAGTYSQTTVNGSTETTGAGGTAVIDWNNDGFSDFIKLSDSRTMLYHLYQNDGTGKFTSAITQTLLTNPVTATFNNTILCLADFNGDGAPDLVAPATDTASLGGVTLFFGVTNAGKWTGEFDTTSTQILTPSVQPTKGANYSGSDILHADFNGDGKQDIALKNGDGIQLFINDGTGQFPAGGMVNLPSVNGIYAENLVAGDFNNDGKTDLASSASSPFGSTANGFYAGQMSLYLNTTASPASTTFAPATGLGSSSNSYQRMAVSDLNLDGNLDLIVASQSFANSYLVYQNDGKGAFSLPVQVFNAFNKSNSVVAGIGVADMNRDGQPDVVTGISWSDNYPVSPIDLASSLSVSINGTFPALGVTPANLPAAVVGQPYSFQLGFTGGASGLPYQVTVNPLQNGLPDGLTVSSTGLISGTPTRSGPSQPIFHISQNNGLMGSSQNNLVVNNQPTTVLQITPSTLPNGTTGSTYSQQLSALYSTGAVVYTLSAGALPSGLSLGASGLISGQLLASGSFTFTVSATDSAQATGSRQYTIVVTAAPIPGPVGPTVLMYPGSNLQTQLPYDLADLAVLYSNATTVVRTIDNKPIDFNRDGFPDLVNITQVLVKNGLPLNAGAAVFPLLNTGSGHYEETTVFTQGTTSISKSEYAEGSAAAVLDWNGDGKQDLLTLQGGTAKGLFRIFEGDGTGKFNFLKSQELFPFGTNVNPEYYQLQLADFNGDGALDLVTQALNSAGSFDVFTGNLVAGKWDGTFDLTKTQNVVSGSSSTSGSFVWPVIADFNNDGKLDFVTPATTGARVFVNDGMGQFSSSNVVDLLTVNQKPAMNLAAADFNGDGKIDLVGSISSQQQGSLEIYGPMSLFLNTSTTSGGTPTFGSATTLGGANSYGGLAVADMNLDGNLDLAVADVNYTGTNKYSVFLGDGAGNFGAETAFIGFSKPDNSPGGIGVGDWNNDGLPDVAMGLAWNFNKVYYPNLLIAQAVAVSINATYQPLTAGALAQATQGQPYSQQIQFKGGNSSLAYNVALSPKSSPLPQGLTLSNTGLITGTPSQPGPFQLVLDIFQPNGFKGTSITTLVVNSATPGVLTISPATLPGGTAGTPYSQQLTVAGATGAVAWAISSGTLPLGLTLSPNGLISGTPSTTGVANFTVSATDSAANTGFRQYSITTGTNPTPPLAGPFIAAGQGQGGLVSIFNADGSPRLTFAPYGTGYIGSVTIAQGDVNGDGIADLVTGTGAGSVPHVIVFDGNTLAPISSFYAYAQAFLGGVRVAAGDVDGDGKAEVITGTGPNSAPNVVVFNATTGATISSFYAYAPEYRGGINVAAGDVTGDGKADIVTGTGVGVSPHVVVFDGTTNQALYSFYAYLPGFMGGVNVATGDIDNDGTADILTGAGPGADPHVKVFSGANGIATQKQSFDAFPTSFNGGVSVASADLNNDGKDDIIVGTQTKAAQVKAFNGADLSVIDDFFAFQGTVGVWVAGG